MARFKLVLSQKDRLDQKAIEFDAEDAAMALVFAHRQSPERSFELWKDDRKLCKINRTPVQDECIWEITARTA